MTDEERKTIRIMTEQGYGYKVIASQLGLSVNTVKSFCHRNGMKAGEKASKYEPYIECLRCGAPLQQTPHKKRKKFCSNTCRLAYWHDQPEELRNRTHHECVCEVCGKTFLRPKLQRFCSTACFAEFRRKGGSGYGQNKEKENAGDRDRQTGTAGCTPAWSDQGGDNRGTELQNLSSHCLCPQCSWFHNGCGGNQSNGKTDKTISACDRKPDEQ